MKTQNIGGKKLTFDPPAALKLYHQLKTDSEIADILGVQQSTIKSWRQRENLKVLTVKKKTKYYIPQKPRSYREVLTPSQSIEMNHFLRVLSKVGRKAVEAGVKPDVGRLINTYIGRGEN